MVTILNGKPTHTIIDMNTVLNNLNILMIFVTRRVTFGPNAEMRLLSKMTSNNASNYYGFYDVFLPAHKNLKSFSLT